MDTTFSEIMHLIHLVMLALWGGVVATEMVIEVLPFRHPDLHPAAIRFHFWIDLLVELPLVIAVAVTGSTLLFLVDEITVQHVVKIAFGCAAIAVNLFCIVVVVRRGCRLDTAEEPVLWRASRIVLVCFVAGLAFATVAATLGFRLQLT